MVGLQPVTQDVNGLHVNVMFTLVGLFMLFKMKTQGTSCHSHTSDGVSLHLYLSLRNSHLLPIKLSLFDLLLSFFTE